MKLPIKKINFKFSLMVNLILALVILSEVYFVYAMLYQSLNPQPNNVAASNIVKVDLKTFQDTSDLLESLENYKPNPLELLNKNPFKYGQ